MTPEPPSPSEGSSLPPRSRPNLGDLVKDGHETDLWAFDDLDSAEDSPESPPTRSKPSIVPVPRALPSKLTPISQVPAKPKNSENPESVLVNAGKIPATAKSGPNLELAKPVKDMDELDDWEVTAPETPTLEIHPSFKNGLAAGESPQSVDREEDLEEGIPQVADSDLASKSAVVDEAPAGAPGRASASSLVPRLGLSALEKIGLGVLLGMLLVGGGLIFLSVSKRLSTDTGRAKTGEFPVKGLHTEILSAETFWRAPITEGNDADTFRRGTQLLPVVKITSKGAPAAVRVFFRDQDGVVMGDAVTRAILPDVPLQVAATTGFDDVGMHAAYRTGQSKPWTLEVLEAQTTGAPNADFKKLFEIEISTDRR